MFIDSRDRREHERSAMANRNPGLFKEMWEKGLYSDSNNIPELIDLFKDIAKGIFAKLKRKK